MAFNQNNLVLWNGQFGTTAVRLFSYKNPTNDDLTVPGYIPNASYQGIRVNDLILEENNDIYQFYFVDNIINGAATLVLDQAIYESIYPSSVPGELRARLSQVISPQDFMPTAGTGVDCQAAFQVALNATIAIAGLNRRPILRLPPGDYLVTNLIINDVQGASALTRGDMVLQGSGIQNTKIISQATSGDVLKIRSGKVFLRDFTITSDQVNRGVILGNGTTKPPTAAIGSGNGIVIDDGVVPRAATIAEFGFHNIQISFQPGHGFVSVGGELITASNITSVLNFGDGIRFDGLNPGGAQLGIGNTFSTCRSIWCHGRGLTELGGIGGLYQNIETLICDGHDFVGSDHGFHIFSTAVGPRFELPDCEGDGIAADQTLNLGAIVLAGMGGQIEGGLIHGFHDFGIRLTGISQRVIGTRISNTAESGTYSMATAIDIVGATKAWVDIPTPGTGVTAAITPSAPAEGNYYRNGFYTPQWDLNGEATTQFRATRVSSDALGPVLSGRKARGTLAAPLAPIQNDQALVLSASGFASAAYRAISNLYFRVIAATPSSTDMQGQFRVDLSPAGSVTPVESLTVDHNNGLSLFALKVIDPDKALIFISRTTAQLTDITNAINTTNKVFGKAVEDSTTAKLMIAQGAAANSTWKSADGGTTITPV